MITKAKLIEELEKLKKNLNGRDIFPQSLDTIIAEVIVTDVIQ